MEARNQSFMQDLKNVEYPSGDMAHILDCYARKETEHVVRKLYRYRKELLDTIHAEQNKLEDLDYIINKVKNDETI